MKLFLEEKLILNEKLNLVEKITLTEETHDWKVLLDTALQKINNLLNELQARADGASSNSPEYTQAQFKELDKQIINLKHKIAGNSDAAKVGGLEVNVLKSGMNLKNDLANFVNQYKTGSELADKLFTKDTPYGKEIQDLINSINKKLTGFTGDQKAIDAVNVDLNKLQSKVEQVLTPVTGKKSDSLQANRSILLKVDKLRQILGAVQDAFAGELTLPEEIDTPLNQVLTKLIKGNLDDPEVSADQKLKTIFDESFANNFNNLMAQLKQDDRFAKSLGDKANAAEWAAKYKAAKNKDLFWKIYINEVWGKKAPTVLKFLKAIQAECEYYGFDEDRNWFIGFLRYLFDNGYDVRPDAYNAIHDALANESNPKFSLQNLLHEPVDLWNIIYCKEFYNKNYEDCTALLDYQRGCIDNTKREQDTVTLTKFLYVMTNTDAKKTIDTFQGEIGDSAAQLDTGKDFWNTNSLANLDQIRFNASQAKVNKHLTYNSGLGKAGLLKALDKHNEDFVKGALIILLQRCTTVEGINNAKELLAKANINTSTQLSLEDRVKISPVLFSFGDTSSDKNTLMMMKDIITYYIEKYIEKTDETPSKE